MISKAAVGVLLGFCCPLMSTVYNLWGFLIPYVAARVS
jgi:hypothetical protein